MDKVYVIIQGCYSDWKIKGYVETEEEAKDFCDKYNKMHEGIGYGNDLYYRVTCKNCFDAQLSKTQYEYDFVFDENNECKSESLSIIEIGPDGIPVDEYGNEIRTGVKIEKWGRFATVVLEEQDIDKARKISQDMLYEYLYMESKEGGM